MKNNLMIKNILYSYGSIMITSLIGFISVPLSLNYFGKSIFGLFSVTNDTLAYLNILNFGIPWAVATIFVKLYSFNAQKKLLIRSLLLLLILSILVSVVLFIIITIYPNWINFFSDIDNNILHEAKLFIAISISIYMIKLPFSVFSQLLIFINRVYITKIIDVVSSIISIGTLFLIIYFKLSLIDFAYISGIISTIVLLSSVYIFLKIWRNNINNSDELPSDTENIKYKNIISGSYYFFLNGIGALFIWNTDSLIIGHYLGLSMIAEYAVLFKFFTLLFMLITQIMNITNPLYPKFLKENSYGKLTLLYNVQIKLFPILGGFIFVMIFGAFKDFVYLWTQNASIFIGYLACFAMAMYCYFLCSSNIPYAAIVSLGHSKIIYKLTLFEAILNFIFSILLVKYIGVAGVIFGTLVAHLLTMFIFAPKSLEKLFPEVFQFDYIFVAKHFIFAVFPACVLIYWLNRYDFSILKLCAFLLICVFYFIISIVVFGRSNVMKTIKFLKTMK